MNSTKVGSIHYDLTLNKSKFDLATDKVTEKVTHVGKRILQFSAASAIAFATFSVKSAASFEQTRISLDNMLGSTDKAKKLLGDLNKFAAETPFEFPELADATKQLIAFGFTGEKAFKAIKNLGDVSAAIGTPINDLAYLMGTLKTQGRAFTIDIRQFAQRGIPIYEYLAKVLKTNTKEISKMIEEGKIGFPEVEKAFTAMTASGEKFHGTMEKQSKSLNGRISTLKDSFMMLGRSLIGVTKTGDVVEGSFFDRILVSAEKLTKWIDRLNGGMNEESNIIPTLAGKITFLDSATRRLNEAKRNLKFTEQELKRLNAETPKLQEAVVSSTERVSKAQSELNKTIRKYGEDSDQAKLAVKRLNDVRYLENDQLVKLASNTLRVTTQTTALRLAKQRLTDATRDYKLMLEGINAKTFPTFKVGLNGVNLQAGKTAKSIQNTVNTMKSGLFNLNGKIGDIQNNVANLAQLGGKQLSGLQSQAGRLNGTLNTTISNSKLEVRATGGPVSAGKPYIVGEKGPEMYIPKNSGTIIPNDKLSSSGSTNFYGNITIGSNVDAENFLARLSRNQELSFKGISTRAGAVG